MSKKICNQKSFEGWKLYVDKSKGNVSWDYHDSKIIKIVNKYNDYLKDTPGYKTLDWIVIKAMIWVETGAESPAWRTKPMQIGVDNDQGLMALFATGEKMKAVV